MKPLERSGKGLRRVSFTSVQVLSIKAQPKVPVTDTALWCLRLHLFKRLLGVNCNLHLSLAKRYTAVVMILPYYLAAALRLEVYSLSSQCPPQFFVNCQVVVVRSKKNIFLILRTLNGQWILLLLLFLYRKRQKPPSSRHKFQTEKDKKLKENISHYYFLPVS